MVNIDTVTEGFIIIGTTVKKGIMAGITIMDIITEQGIIINRIDIGIAIDIAGGDNYQFSHNTLRK